MGYGRKGDKPRRLRSSSRLSDEKMDPDVIHYYGKMADEDKRVNIDISRFEYARTKEIIGRYLPSEPLTIMDVGGGTGVYSFWLAQKGHRLHLIDIVPRHIALAREKSSKSTKPLESIHLGNAKSLPFENNSADLLLLMGPLYHITERRNRILVLKECARVLKRRGIIFCAAISRFASLLDGFRLQFFNDPRFERIVNKDLRNGQHRNTAQEQDYFTTAYFHKPKELREEMAEAGLKCETLIGVEGPVGIMKELNEWLDKNGRLSKLALKYMKLVEDEESLLGVSYHLLAIGTNR